jgi:flavin reductase (DIM6/NTAB) family NADH-FMN oxidoreductase RutF
MADALIRTDALSPRERYQLLTSLVVPRPIGWLSTASAAGTPNLAPFSYFAALAATPMLVGASIGARRGLPKDTLANIRETRAFCVNIASAAFLDALNASSGEFAAEVDEFAVAGVALVPAEAVAAPAVAGCPAVLECRLFKEVELEGAANVLVIGEVVAVRLAEWLETVPGTRLVRTESLDPIARLWGDHYLLGGEIVSRARPAVDGHGRPHPPTP